MTSFLKKSFFLQFVFYFSIVLIILGVMQATLGTVRLFNASEQEYEKLSPDTVYTISGELIPTSEKAIPQEQESEESVYNVAEDIFQPSPSQEPLKAPVSTQNTKSEKKENPVIMTESLIDILVTPEEEIPPK
jgi:cytoskeletal protein RodZ